MDLLVELGFDVVNEDELRCFLWLFLIDNDEILVGVEGLI